MNQDLKQIKCDDICGFLVRSHDEKELLDIVRIHAKTAHKMEVSDADLKARMTTEPEPAASKR